MGVALTLSKTMTVALTVNLIRLSNTSPILSFLIELLEGAVILMWRMWRGGMLAGNATASITR